MHRKIIALVSSAVALVGSVDSGYAQGDNARRNLPEQYTGAAGNALASQRLSTAATNLVASSGASDHHITYGPTRQDAERVVRPGANITDVISQFGAPFATYDRGDTVIYRFGHGVNEMRRGVGYIERNELLVTTDRDGVVRSMSYRNRGSVADLDAAGYLASPSF